MRYQSLPTLAQDSSADGLSDAAGRGRCISRGISQLSSSTLTKHPSVREACRVWRKCLPFPPHSQFPKCIIGGFWPTAIAHSGISALTEAIHPCLVATTLLITSSQGGVAGNRSVRNAMNAFTFGLPRRLSGHKAVMANRSTVNCGRTGTSSPRRT